MDVTDLPFEFVAIEFMLLKMVIEQLLQCKIHCGNLWRPL